jgi:hypothetical protein
MQSTVNKLWARFSHRLHMWSESRDCLFPDAVSHSSVPRYFREARFPPSKPEPHPADVQRDLDELDSDQAILAALEDSPFTSVRQLSRLTHLSRRRPSIVYHRLTQSL